MPGSPQDRLAACRAAGGSCLTAAGPHGTLATRLARARLRRGGGAPLGKPYRKIHARSKNPQPPRVLTEYVDFRPTTPSPGKPGASPSS